MVGPGVEILLAILIILKRTRLIAAVWCIYINVWSFIVQVVILNLSDKVPCSCGWYFGKMDWTTHLVFNIRPLFGWCVSRFH